MNLINSMLQYLSFLFSIFIHACIFGPNISRTTGWIGIEFYSDIHDSRSMNSHSCGGPPLLNGNYHYALGIELAG